MLSFTSIQDLRNYINQKVYINTSGDIEADQMNLILQGICDYLSNTAQTTFYIFSVRISATSDPAAGNTTYQDAGLMGRTILSFTRDGVGQSTKGDTPYTFNPNYFDAASGETVGLITLDSNTPWRNNEVINIVAT